MLLPLLARTPMFLRFLLVLFGVSKVGTVPVPNTIVRFGLTLGLSYHTDFHLFLKGEAGARQWSSSRHPGGPSCPLGERPVLASSTFPFLSNFFWFFLLMAPAAASIIVHLLGHLPNVIQYLDIPRAVIDTKLVLPLPLKGDVPWEMSQCDSLARRVGRGGHGPDPLLARERLGGGWPAPRSGSVSVPASWLSFLGGFEGSLATASGVLAVSATPLSSSHGVSPVLVGTFLVISFPGTSWRLPGLTRVSSSFSS